MPPESKLHAILNHKCPRCRKGKLFRYSLLRAPLKFSVTNTHCPVCDLRFEREPGFFFGAMYISYAFNVAILFITGFILFNIFDDPSLWIYVVTAPAVVLLLLPLIFRYSRTLYLYGVGNISYQQKFAQEQRTETR